ncbi:hypothetical protein QBC35DRAFT_500639 [Podospora australis]|uniref:HD domain-containing protein n=1 Tax=Podospora australis TaxID=1536484 RepID=A0AAN7AFH0_9PEZI|nr:hypothetical protein QBC35DRAFT_500639 [Podospora australis]
MRINFFTALLLQAAALIAPSSQHIFSIPGTRSISRYPVRKIAGVSVVDTPIVRAAQEFARSHSSDHTYKHVMRSWLFGAIIISRNETLKKSMDLEVHAVSVLLHDLGWDRTPNSSLVSPDKRFEVDGAIASRKFLKSHKDGRKWDERRVQLVWDAIALHTERGINQYKEHEVAVSSAGISLDFEGPLFGVQPAEYDAIVREFPKDGFKTALNETFIWLCGGKPFSTYNTWMQPWGDRYVPGYNSSANSRIETIFRNLP